MLVAAMARKPYKHDPQTVERGLAAMVRACGNSRRARRLLADEGIEVDHSTLHRWKHQHADHYKHLARQGG
jgi:transposase-like protein